MVLLGFLLVALLWPVVSLADVGIAVYHSYSNRREVDKISAATGALLQTQTIALTDPANKFAYGDGYYWIYHSYSNRREVDKISASTGQLVETLTLVFTDPANQFGYGDGYFWIYHSYSNRREVDKISASTGQLAQTLPLPFTDPANGFGVGDPCPVCPGSDGDGSCAESCDELNSTCTAADPGGSVCNDGLFCNGADSCNAGMCSTHAGNPCPGPDGDENCAESCNETAHDCTALDPSGSACAADSNSCTLDQCDGSSVSCQHPAGNAGAVCLVSAGQCDVAETCTGSSTTCPADGFASSATACTGVSQGGACNNDATDHCTGTSSVCVDVFSANTVTCRASTGQCDVAESCTGSSGSCPADGFQPAGTACGSHADTDCDNPDSCLNGVCQSDYEPSGFPCTDENACTTDACVNGHCVGTAVDCDDHNPCTDDSCDPADGCHHELGSANVPGCVQPPSGLIGWWPLDETSGTASFDIIGQNDGTHVGGPLPVAGRVASALSFDGNDDKVVVNSMFPFHQPGDATWGFWLNTPATGHQAVFWTRPNDTDTNYFQIFINGDSTIGLNYRAPDQTLHTLVGICCTGVPIPRDTWTHVAITRTSNVYRLYLDAALRATATDTSPDLPTAIGWQMAGRGGYKFRGMLDEVELYDRALSDSEIQAIFVAGGAGHCKPLGPNSCDDGNACTDDSCDPATGCVHTPNTAPCDDHDACTTGDTCGGGICSPGGPTVCNDGNACTSNICNPQTGLCEYPAIVCDDNNTCTDDSCNPATGCVNANNTSPCSDGNACTRTDACQAGICTGGNPAVCTALDECHDAGICDPGSGFCSNPVKANGTPCNDGNACTQTDRCYDGVCSGPAASVNRVSEPGFELGGVDWTFVEHAGPDSWDPAHTGQWCAYVNAPLAGVSGSVSQTISTTPGHAYLVSFWIASNCCAAGDISVSFGSAEMNWHNLPPNMTYTEYSFGAVATTSNSVFRFSGTDLNGTYFIDDVSVFDVSCSGDCTGAPDGTACNDGNACTSGDTCSGGSCQPGTAAVCNDNNACTDDSCDPATGCVHTPYDCNDDSGCNAVIINVDARTNSVGNPVVVFFTAGTYRVTPIGVAQGGAYNAWDPFGSGSIWWTVYFIQSNEFLIRRGEHGGFYSTDIEALAHADAAIFTLTSDQNLDFSVADSYYGDNTGGMSLRVTPIVTLRVATSVSGTEVSWRSVGSGVTYDLVRGDLDSLRSSNGDFTVALDAIAPGTDVCMANDTAALSVIDARFDPLPGDVWFYVVRCGTSGYNSGSSSQRGDRDSEIAVSANTCP